MQHKIYIDGNFVIVGSLFELDKKLTRITKNHITPNVYDVIFNEEMKLKVNFADIVDENNNPYTQEAWDSLRYNLS